MAKKTITKRDLAKAVADKNGLTQTDALEIIQTLLDQIIGELGDGNRLELRDFGIFEPRLRKGRKARNPRTNEEVYAEEKATVKFKVGKNMKEQVQESLDELKRRD